MNRGSFRCAAVSLTFPLTEEVPYRDRTARGDEVDSIRTFDPESQRSIEQVDEAVIYPATEMALTPEQIQDGTEAIREGTVRNT